MRLPVPPVADSLIAGAFVLFTVAEALFSAGVRSPLEHIVVAGIAMGRWPGAGPTRSGFPSGWSRRTS